MQPIYIKGIMKIALMIFNLFLYCHWLACLLNLAAWYNAPEVYFVQTEGTYKNVLSGEVLLNPENNLPLNYTGVNFIYGEKKYFKELSWNRLDPENVLGYEVYNERWDSRSRQWYTPIDWVNFSEQELHTE